MLVNRIFTDFEIEQFCVFGRVHTESASSFGERVGIILIHGRAGDETLMWVFSRAIEELNPVVVAPRGLVADPIGGYSWWNLLHDSKDQESPSPSQSKLEQISPAIETISNMAKKMPEMYGVDPKKIFVLGFSQGGGVAISCALENPGMFRGVGLLASFVPSVVRDRFEGIKVSDFNVFISHGTQDKIIPIARAQEGLDFLTGIGATVKFNRDDVGHKISSTGIKSFKSWISALG